MNRRQFLLAGGTAGLVATTGCLGDTGDGTDGTPTESGGGEHATSPDATPTPTPTERSGPRFKVGIAIGEREAQGGDAVYPVVDVEIEEVFADVDPAHVHVRTDTGFDVTFADAGAEMTAGAAITIVPNDEIPEGLDADYTDPDLAEGDEVRVVYETDGTSEVNTAGAFPGLQEPTASFSFRRTNDPEDDALAGHRVVEVTVRRQIGYVDEGDVYIRGDVDLDASFADAGVDFRPGSRVTLVRADEVPSGADAAFAAGSLAAGDVIRIVYDADEVTKEFDAFEVTR